MNERDFVYWLKGFVELTPESLPTADQWAMILEHLALVGMKVTPQLGVIVKNGPDHKIQPSVDPQSGTPDWRGPHIPPFQVIPLTPDDSRVKPLEVAPERVDTYEREKWLQDWLKRQPSWDQAFPGRILNPYQPDDLIC